MSSMSVLGISAGAYYQSSTAGQAVFQEGGQALEDTLKEEKEIQPTLTEMMKDAREKAAEREKMFQLPKNSRRYGDAALTAYSKLARARSLGEVESASGYARRQIAQLRMAKRSDSENADRIQAAINQLQKAVNRAGRKKRELSQEKVTATRQARLEREKRTREAKRLRHQLNNRKTMRQFRESGYLREAQVDNRIQDYLAASKLELREQMRELEEATQIPVETAIQQYTSASIEPAPAPEISIQV